MKTIAPVFLAVCLIGISAVTNLSVAQQMVDRSPVWFYHDDDTYIRAHDNHKYFQEYTFTNGVTYMYYNKTYNNKSKELYFYKLSFDSTGKVTSRNELDYKSDDFSDSLYFEKDINMNSAFFAVDDFLFVVVQNEKRGKNQMYRYCISLDTLQIVDLDNGSFYDRYFSAAVSGYDVILFTRGYAESYTFSTTNNNLHYNERIHYQGVSDDAAVVSAVAAIPPYQDDPLAYAALKDPDQGTFQICSFNFKDLSDNLIQTGVFAGKAMRLVNGRSYLPGPNQIANTDGSAYISIFSTEDEVYKGDNTKKYYKGIPIVYGEIKLTDISFIATAYQAYINFASDDYYATDGDDALIDIIENYIPMDCTQVIPGNDGYRKQNILVSCDRNNETNYSVYPSDFYLVNNDDPPVQDDMLDYTDDQWKQTWSLVGIFDGAPPCALNWHAWDSIHQQAGTEIAPTELVWEIGGESQASSSVATENTWSIGCKGSITPGKRVQFSFGAGGKYALTNEKINELTKTVAIELAVPMPLTEENQTEGVWFWLVPSITRVAYSVYDYSDSQQFKHPILGSIDYSFITNGYTLQARQMPLDSAPHYVVNPNLTTMMPWRDRADMTNPNSIASHAFAKGLNSAATVSYDSFNGGTTGTLIESGEQTTEQSTTSTKSFNLSAGVKIPKIFTFKVAFSDEWNYTTSNTISSTFSQGVEFNLKNLEPGSASAIYPESYYVKPYFFTPDDYSGWWYFNNPEFMGFKPWYIAYTVVIGSDVLAKELQLITPESNELYFEDETVTFSWTPGLQQTKMVITNAPVNALKAVVHSYEKATGCTGAVNGLAPGTYYWRVGGVNQKNTAVWSEFRKFTIIRRDFLADHSDNPRRSSCFVLPAKVYPNPSFAQPVTITYEVKDEKSPVTVTLFSMSGIKQFETVNVMQSAGVHQQVIPAEYLTNQVGILKIINGNYMATQKIVVY